MIINTVQGGKAPVVQSKSVKSTTSQQIITAPSGVDGYNPITVEPIKLQTKTVEPLDSQQTIVADTGYDGLSEIIVNATSGPKIGVWTERATDTSKIRITNTQGITIPYFVVIQYNQIIQLRNFLLTAIWCSTSDDFVTRCAYMDNNFQVSLESGGINVSMDGDAILIEITSSNFHFQQNYFYKIFISESV